MSLPNQVPSVAQYNAIRAKLLASGVPQASVDVLMPMPPAKTGKQLQSDIGAFINGLPKAP